MSHSAGADMEDAEDAVFAGPVTQQELIITWLLRRNQRLKREKEARERKEEMLENVDTPLHVINSQSSSEGCPDDKPTSKENVQDPDSKELKVEEGPAKKFLSPIAEATIIGAQDGLNSSSLSVAEEISESFTGDDDDQSRSESAFGIAEYSMEEMGSACKPTAESTIQLSASGQPCVETENEENTTIEPFIPSSDLSAQHRNELNSDVNNERTEFTATALAFGDPSLNDDNLEQISETKDARTSISSNPGMKNHEEILSSFVAESVKLSNASQHDCEDELSVEHVRSKLKSSNAESRMPGCDANGAIESSVSESFDARTFVPIDPGRHLSELPQTEEEHCSMGVVTCLPNTSVEVVQDENTIVHPGASKELLAATGDSPFCKPGLNDSSSGPTDEKMVPMLKITDAMTSTPTKLSQHSFKGSHDEKIESQFDAENHSSSDGSRHVPVSDIALASEPIDPNGPKIVHCEEKRNSSSAALAASANDPEPRVHLDDDTFRRSTIPQQCETEKNGDICSSLFESFNTSMTTSQHEVNLEASGESLSVNQNSRSEEVFEKPDLASSTLCDISASGLEPSNISISRVADQSNQDAILESSEENESSVTEATKISDLAQNVSHADGETDLTINAPLETSDVPPAESSDVPVLSDGCQSNVNDQPVPAEASGADIIESFSEHESKFREDGKCNSGIPVISNNLKLNFADDSKLPSPKAGFSGGHRCSKLGLIDASTCTESEPSGSLPPARETKNLEAFKTSVGHIAGPSSSNQHAAQPSMT
ncbi:unnamed protein product, partial [Nesidiocoris tenuis]